MAVFFNKKNKKQSVTKEQSKDQLSWMTAGLCLGAGAVVGFGLVPAYAGMAAASLVPTCPLPLVGAALTESAKVQATTLAYNTAMWCAPLVTQGTSYALKSSIIAANSALRSEPEAEESTVQEELSPVSPVLAATG